MKRLLVALIALALFLSMLANAQRLAARSQRNITGQEETYDYWKFNREMIRRGQQAILMCKGLFTSNRSLEQVFEKELSYLSEPIGTPTGGDYSVDWGRKAVAIGSENYVPTMRAVFRKGIGCVI